MKTLKLKPQDLAFFGKASLGERPRFADDREDTLKLSNLMLAIQKLLGKTLSGIAVSIQVGNLLVCVSMLLLGPAVVVNLLAM